MAVAQRYQVTIHGHDVTYRMGGRGSRVLLIHGMAGSSRTWKDVTELLVRDHTVIAPDLLGRGAGEPLGELPESLERGVVDVGVRHGHLPVRCRPKPCHGPGACQFILSDTRRIVRIANAIAAPTQGLKTSKCTVAAVSMAPRVAGIA